MQKSKIAAIAATALAIVALIGSQFITIFVIQPIGVIPDGATMIIHRHPKTKFIDSADAICEREMGGVSILCRIGVLAGIAQNSPAIMRLPYSSQLYLYSTGGKTYDR